MLITVPLLVALLLGQAPPERPRSPWFLPRYAALGAYAGNDVFSPTVRLGWELAIIEQKTELVFVLELGPSFGVVRPGGVTFTYQHTLLAGVGLRPARSNRIQWGLSAMAGPVLYGGQFTDPTKNEERLNGVVDGRAQLGVNLGRITLAGYVGYQQPFSVNPRFAASGYVGGVSFGVLVNWR